MSPTMPRKKRRRKKKSSPVKDVIEMQKFGLVQSIGLMAQATMPMPVGHEAVTRNIMAGYQLASVGSVVQGGASVIGQLQDLAEAAKPRKKKR